LATASAMLRPRRGRVRLDGVDVTGASPQEVARRGLCHITEGRSVFPSLTVADNLRIFAPAKRAGEAVDRAATAFPVLGRRLNQVAGTMSGGEQQMLALARAYARRAPVVLVDEVSAGLAPMLVEEIFEFLAQMAHEGTSLLIV